MAAAAVSPKLKAIVTGANKGIGFEIAKGLGGQGFHVIMACRDLALGETAAQELRSLHASTSFDVMELDVSKPDSIAKFIENVNANYSGSIDVLVNNAAIAFKNKDPMPFKDQAEPTFQPNFFGAVQLTMGLLPSIKNSSRKCIVNVASMAGHLKIFPGASPKRTKFESSASTLTVNKTRILPSYLI
jgi:carbonyl reductase 1